VFEWKGGTVVFDLIHYHPPFGTRSVVLFSGDIGKLLDFYLGDQNPLLTTEEEKKKRKQMGNPVQQPNFKHLLGTLSNIVCAVKNTGKHSGLYVEEIMFETCGHIIQLFHY
jgi:hypothetical protein